MFFITVIDIIIIIIIIIVIIIIIIIIVIIISITTSFLRRLPSWITYTIHIKHYLKCER